MKILLGVLQLLVKTGNRRTYIYTHGNKWKFKRMCGSYVGAGIDQWYSAGLRAGW